MFLPVHVKVHYGLGLFIKKIRGTDNKYYIAACKESGVW